MEEKEITRFPDRLKMEGVLCLGYGIVCKFPMTDPDLSVPAKAVYAMICAYSSNGTTAFPSREKFIHHLKIGKDKFYAAMKQLTEQGYITVRKHIAEHGHFANNEYTVVSNPKKFEESTSYKSNGGTLTTAVGYTGLKKAGYGAIPRSVICDARLSATAKVLYAYIASFTGGGTAAFPATSLIEYHLGISQNTYQRHMQQLIKYNYISVTQRHIDGRLASNCYNVNDKPDESTVLSADERRKQKKLVAVKHNARDQAELQIPQSKDMVTPGPQIHQNKDTVELQIPQYKDTIKQDTANQDTVKQYTVLQDTDLRDIINNSSFKNSSLNISPSIGGHSTHWIDRLTKEEIVDYLGTEKEPYEMRDAWNLELSDSEIKYITEIITDFICSGQQNLRIRGVLHDRAEVIDKLLELDASHYEYVKKKINAVSGQIKNLRSYYLVCLYSAADDYDAELKRQVAQDLRRYPEIGKDISGF